MALRSLKTNFVCTHRSLFHTTFNIFDHVDFASHTNWGKIVCLGHLPGNAGDDTDRDADRMTDGHPLIDLTGKRPFERKLK